MQNMKQTQEISLKNESQGVVTRYRIKLIEKNEQFWPNLTPYAHLFNGCADHRKLYALQQTGNRQYLYIEIRSPFNKHIS